MILLTDFLVSASNSCSVLAAKCVIFHIGRYCSVHKAIRFREQLIHAWPAMLFNHMIIQNTMSANLKSEPPPADSDGVLRKRSIY